MTVHISEDIFGNSKDPFTQEKKDIIRYTFTNDLQTTVQVITLGATITTIKVPDGCGIVDDVVLGYDTVDGYQSANNPYFGATVGRVCNRVGNGTFLLDGNRINVSKNFAGKHQLHGGFTGFDKAHWIAHKTNDDTVVMTHVSPDGHEGYPGDVSATVIYKLTDDNSFHVNFSATTNKPTAINLTNHSYFNLAGHGAGAEEIYEHLVKIKADKYTITDEDSIPTGEFQNVTGTPYDLRELGKLGPSMQKSPTGGFDDNFCVNLIDNQTTMIAKVSHPKSGRFLSVETNQPGCQFYTSNHMPDTSKNERPIIGKSAAQYYKHGALCLETQKYPDAPNHDNFPSIILKPGETYNHEIIYKFGTCKDSEAVCNKK